MAFQDPESAFDNIMQGVSAGLQSAFPIHGRTRSLVLENVRADKTTLDPHDIPSQYKARMEKGSWTVPVRGDVVLRERLTDGTLGKELSRKDVLLMDVPRMTSRLSFIHKGQEYQVSNQWQLKPGVYGRRRQNGELEARFNVTGRAAFDMTFDPETKTFEIDYKKAKLPAYPILRALGASDADLEKAWGADILRANQAVKRNATTLAQFHRTSTNGATPSSEKEVIDNLHKVMEASKLRPEVTAHTLGAPFEHVTHEALTLAGKKLISINNGAPEDDRDAIIFKTLRSTGELLQDQLKSKAQSIATKIQRQLNKEEVVSVAKALSPGTFNSAVSSLFRSSLANPAKQVNPLDMMSSAMSTTIMGPGGIKSDMQVTDEAKMIHPSHFAFVDPLATPEGCHDPLTEVFTERGWVPWPEVTEEDRFGCMVDGRMVFEFASRIVVKEHRGVLHGVETGKRPIGYRVTPQHRMWVRPLDNECLGYRFETAEEMFGKDRLFTLTHEPYLGEPKERFALDPAFSDNPIANLGSVVNVETVDYEDWGAFYGWFLSEGCVHINVPLSKYQVKLFQSYPLHAAYCQEIEGLLRRLGLPYTLMEREQGRRVYTISRKQVALLLQDQGKSSCRYIPEHFFSSPLKVRQALLDAMMKGDGRKPHQRKDGTWQMEQVYTTTSPRLAKDVDRLAATLGLPTSHRVYRDTRSSRYLPVHEIRFLRGKTKQVLKKHQRQIPYEGLVYCATVPGGLLYVRRGKGVPHWSGNSSTGVVLRLPLGVKKVGEQPHIPLYNIKTGKQEWVDPITAYTKKVVLADQVEFKDGKPHALHPEVSMMGADNKMTKGKLHEADYVLPHSSMLFNLSSAIVPFVDSDSGNRVSMAVRHMEQSISLQDRDKPLVQVVDPSGSTFEQTFGKQVAHTAPAAGKVVEVSDNHIRLKDAKGVEHKIHLYNYYPLNDTKSVLHSTPLVKVGDKVEAGQVVADNNYTREGTLALGKNLRVAYMPFHGMNFEDSLVITESAAKKLASVHLHKHEVPIAEQTIIDTKKYLQQHPGSFSNKQLTHIGEDGVVKVGAKVRPGDPMVLAMQPYSVKDRVGLGALRKSLTNQFTDKALRWDSDHEGEVVAVHRGPEGVQVHVKTIEPMQVADKMSNRHGGKGVVGYIIPDHEAPKDKDGKPVDVLFNPCYDAETEFLTERGWVKGPDLQDREVFGTLNPKTYELEYQGGETQRTPYRGPMYRLESQHLDLMVTPNHSNFVATRSPGALGTLDLSTLSPGTFRREEARDHFGKARRFLKVGRWKGEEPGWVTIPAAERGASGPASEELMFLVEDYAEFLGWFVAEGSTYRTPAGAYCVDVAQRLSANPVKYRMIEGLIRRMGLNPNPGKDGFRIFNKSLFQHLRPLGKAHEKYVPEHIQKLSPRLLKIFLDAYLLGDGNTRNEPERGHHGSRRFCTVSKKLLDGLQLVAFKQGLVVNAHPAKERGVETQRPRYDAAVGAYSKAPWSNWSKETKENQIEAWIPYEGTVYCTQVPNGTLVVRRNGKIVVSGNCGVGGRMNVGQILETMAGKVAQKTGETYKVTNFDPHNKDRVEHMQSLLKKHGISDTEELFDPKTGQSYGHVLTGPQHFIKLVHQADKKLSVRSGMGLPKLPSDEKYDSMTFQPAGGGGTGGQSYGQLGMYALLAHGATNLLREAMTVKSQGEDPETNEAKRWKTGHADAWIAMQKGLPLPPPRPTFAFHRFTELLKAAGVNMEKKGSELMLSPMTDKQILSMSKGEVVNPTAAVHAKIDPQTNHYKTIKGGLFDDQLTGGHGGTHWTHVALTEPMPNPLFEDPIKKLTGLTKSSFESILYGHKQVLPSTGALVDKGGVTGGEGIKALLKNIDVKRELQATLAKLKKAPASSVDELYRKASYLQGLDKLGLRPEEAYILHNVPVLPPKLRPLSIMEDGALRYEDLNGFYMNIGQLNSALTRLQDMPDKVKADTRKGMYEGISALFGAHALPEGAKVKGILHQIAGSSPKEGLFQKGLLSPRQDATMRGVIIPGPDLHLDQVGLPKHAALVQYRPFVIKHMVQSGLAKTELDAQLMLSEVHQGKRQEMGVWRALERAVAERPILLKRDPALHKESILAFKPVLIEGNSIKLHPLVSGGFNADHDGDSCLGEVTYLQVSEQTTEVRQVNLADFPRLEDTKKTTGSVDVYQTPAGIYVMGNWLGRTQPCLVTEYSVHRDLKMVVVGLGNRQKVKCSQDHSLATLNPRTLLIERTSPADALGRAVPLVSLNQGHLTDTIACGGVLYQATADLGRQLGGLWASPVRELGSGWGEILPDILQKALALPLIFRKAFVREVLSERLDRTSGEVLTSDGKERSELSWLLSSCGLASRIRDHKLKLDLLTLLRAEWLSIPGKHLCTWADRFKVYTPEWVRQELRIPSSSDWLSRKYVTKYLGRVSEVSGYLRAWRELCYENAGFWTRVASVKNTGDKVTMYDLTVEGALNFALSTGVVVWDTMSGYVPADEASIREAQRMFPSKNIFNEATTAPSHVPTMEARLGLHRLGKVGDTTSHKFDTHSQAIDALARQRVKLSDQIQVGGKTTTPGRILLATAVPEPFKAKVLHDFEAQMDTKGLKSLFAEVGKKTPEEYTKFADAMKDLGNATSTGMIRSTLTTHPVIAVGAHSYRLQDFSTDKAVRDPILQQAHDKVRTIQGLKITDVEKERRTVDTYLSAFQEINKAHLAKEKTAPVKNNLLTMTEAGVKPSKDQYAQMRIAPGIMKDSKGTLLPTPIQRSYGEGLTLSEYWTGTYGARSGSVKKVQEVQEPGYMTKLLQNTSMGMLIDSHDCGTTQGRLMPITHADVADRHLASELKIGGMHLPAGTLLSKDVVDQIRSLDPQAQIHVRSPLHCHSEKGVCQKCFGLAANGHHHPQGTNVGVLSAHALGERAVQLTLKAFHCMDRHTLVLCRRGERIFHTTLGELFEEGGPSAHEGSEEWRTLSEVTEVWDYEGWTRIVRAGRHLQQAGTRMVLARASDGAGILSQDNHPHMLLRREGAEMQAVPPAEVRQGDHFLRATEPEPTYTAPPLQQGWLAGIYCAEGSLIVRQQHERDYLVGIQISQKNTSPVYPRILEALCKEYGPGRYGASGRYFQVYGKERAEHFAQTFRRYSRNIGLPAGWSGYPRQWLLDFVSGMFDGDGSVYQPKDGGSRWRARVETTSWRLVQQVRHILAKEGVPVRVDVTPWRKLSRNQGFSLSITVTERVRELLTCSTKIQSCTPIAAAGLGSSPPIFIKEVRFEGAPWVYDIETESHTFFANGILTHNSGGSVSSRSGGALGAFQRLEQLTYLPDKIPNAATMSRASGEITKITPTSTGTEIHIGDQVHFVGKDREGRPLHVHLPEEDKAPGYKPWTPPKVGMKVERGQTLTDPNRTLINPHRLYEATGDMTKVQHFLADELHNIYSDEGVRKRAVEVVVRAMGNVTKIHEPHDHEGLLRGQFYPKTAVDKINQERTQAGKRPIEHSPALIGVDLLPLAATQDWLAVLNHQKLRSTLKRNAAMGAVSNIHGSHPIPGLAFGVEFGKPPAGSKTPY